MQIEATKKRFNVDEYYRMAEVGIFGPDERVELIDGEIIQMSAMGPRHAWCLIRMTDRLTAALRGRAFVSPQIPLRLSGNTEPEPDLALLRASSDSRSVPAAPDAVLVVEISDKTLRYDRDVKLPLYAAAGIPEAWIIDLKSDQLNVYREPSRSGYTVRQVLRRGDSLSVTAFPDVGFQVEDFLG